MSTVLAYSVAGASKDTGLSPSFLKQAINRGALKARRSSVDENGNPVGKYVIFPADLEAYLASLPEA